MNTPVNFELAKLLKEKGYNKRTPMVWLFSLGEAHLRKIHLSLELNDAEYNAPTIAEVVMWFYEKHEIWIQASISRYGIFYCNILKKENTRSLDNPISWEMQAQLNDFNSPTEAYESAIEYCLNNLINQ